MDKLEEFKRVQIRSGENPYKLLWTWIKQEHISYQEFQSIVDWVVNYG